MTKKPSTVRKSVRKAVTKPTVGKVMRGKATSPKRDPKLTQPDPKRQLKIQKALYEIADAASAVKDMGSFYKKLHRIVGRLMYAENFFIATYDEQSGLLSFPYFVDERDEAPVTQPLADFHGVTGHVIRTGKMIGHAISIRDEVLTNQGVELVGSESVDGIAIPLQSNNRTIGAIIVQSYTRGVNYTVEDDQVLEFVGQHIATALTRARALEAERRRTDELAILNSVGEAMAKTLDVKTVAKIVGDKVRDIFRSTGVSIMLLDSQTNLIHVHYEYDKGEGGYIDYIEPFPLGKGLATKVIQSRQPLLLGSVKEQAANGGYIPPELLEKGTGVISESAMFVPIVVGDKVLGVVSVSNYERNFFNISNLSLLQTLSTNMGVAIQNARLFEAEQERVAELQIINSIQQGLAAELDFQAIVDLVGDKLREVFNTPDLIITWYDEKQNLVHYLYGYEHGKRLTTPPQPPTQGGIFQTLVKTRKPLVWNTQAEQIGGTLPGTDRSKSLVSVPIISSDRVFGSLRLENYERENAYGESELRLLTTIAASLGTALENAHLFDETQRLFKAEQERVAELQIINSIQRGLAAELDFQAIVDLVGDKLREVLNTPDLGIRWYDEKNNLLHYAYSYEHNKRIHYEPSPPTPGGIFEAIVKSRQPQVFNSPADRAKLNAPLLGTEVAVSSAYFPIISSDRVLGLINTENYERENAFGESEIRLLTTIAASLGTALENARLFDETQRLFKAEQERVAELQIINSIQQGLAAQLEMQGIYDLVGDKLQEIFSTSDIAISIYDAERELISTPYYSYLGERVNADVITDWSPTDWRPIANAPIQQYRIRLGKTLVINHNFDEWAAKFGSNPLPGTKHAKSSAGTPIIVGDKVIGLIILTKYEVDEGYTESDVRLISTLASSLGVALENARLFKAEQERVAELQIINSIQQGLAAELDFQAIVDLVGDKIRDIFNAQAVVLATFDLSKDLMHRHYVIEKGQRQYVKPHPIPNGWMDFIEKRQTLLVNTNFKGWLEERNSFEVPEAGMPKSVLSVPLVMGELFGVISLQNLDMENAFSDSDVRLLQTLANSLSIALQNAQSFKAEQERVAELQIINSIQQGLAAELDFQAIVDLVGDKLREVFQTPDLIINWYDEKANLIHYLYFSEHGRRMSPPPQTPRPGGIFETHRRTRQPIVFNSLADYEKYNATVIEGTEQGKSYASVPIISSDRLLGAIGLENFERENAFGESELRLLTTVSASLGTALENARLFDETQRLFKAEQERVAELQIINSIQQGLAAELDFQAIVDLVGDKLSEVLHTGDLSITWYDEKSNLLHNLYAYEHGQRLTLPITPPTPGGMFEKMVETRQPVVENTADYLARIGATSISGTDQSKSFASIPIISSDRVLGGISMENYERENAFGESELRLLTTIAASLGTALENARLFDETQRLLKETEERNAELAVINSVQQGLASKLEMQAIYDLVAMQLAKSFQAPVVDIIQYNRPGAFYDYLGVVMNGKRVTEITRRIQLTPEAVQLIETLSKAQDEPFVLREGIVSLVQGMGYGIIKGMETLEACVAIPVLSTEDEVTLIILLTTKDAPFDQNTSRLFKMIANATALTLENARLFDETQRLFKAEQERVTELAVINSVQTALASKLDFQGIVDAVGNKLAEIFSVENVGIGFLDKTSGMMKVPYLFENGKRIENLEFPIDERSLVSTVVATRRPLLINRTIDPRSKRPTPKSWLGVPILINDEVIGGFTVQNWERENAFSESDVRLLQTLAGSLGVALENARLFKAEQERVAELQIINSIQQGLAAELDFQAIVDLVGDKLREVFNTTDLGINWYDEKANLLHNLYIYEHGKRLALPPQPPRKGGMFEVMTKTRQPVVLNNIEDYARLNATPLPGTDQGKSYVNVPIISSDRVLGAIGIENFERENAFGESELRLLTTIAASLGTALENARLFDETQRLFKAEQERVAELQIINSIQQGLAAELDFQAIVDLVGDKLSEIFKTGDLGIRWYDEKANLLHYLYEHEHGERLFIPPDPPVPGGIFSKILKTRQPIVYKTSADYGVRRLLPGTDPSKSLISVPIISSDRVLGVITMENYERENAYGESEIRLLTTIAASLGTALENARLFDETQRLLKITEDRAAELAIINSVQQALAAKLDMQGIYTTVGEKLREIFSAQAIIIYSGNLITRMETTEYVFEKGQRLERITEPLNPIAEYILGLNKTFVRNKDFPEFAAQFKDYVLLQGEMPVSVMETPVIRNEGDGFYLNVSIMDMDGEKTFDDSDVRLLETFANSMSVALQNAQSFKAEQERVAELQIINSIQQGLAAELDFQAIVDLVGDKLREVFTTGNLGINWYDEKSNLIHVFYCYEHGQRIVIEPYSPTPGGLVETMKKSRQPIVYNTPADFGEQIAVPGTDIGKSLITAPIISSDRLIGTVQIENHERENAFGESEIRLLTTIAASLGTALENARLFDETQQRNAELAIINSVQASLAAKLEMQAIYDAVGDKIQEIFDAQVVMIVTHDKANDLAQFSYAIEKGERLNIYPRPIGGISGYVIRTGQTVMINQNLAQREMEILGTPAIIPAGDDIKSRLDVPMMVGTEVKGCISLQNVDRENAFSESDLRLLTTLANSMSVALENARLFDETQRLLKITEDRAAELAIINSVQAALAAELNIQGIYDAVGDKIREIFHGKDLGIRIYDPQTNTIHFPYTYENGERIAIDSLQRTDKGFTDHVLRTRETVLINETMEEEVKKYGSYIMPGTQSEKSALYVPLVAGDQARGLINLVDMEHEHAFSDSDVRLLQTLANSMSVALENARLFDETQRLLKITEDRAAELAIINSVQEGLASKLDMQAIYDLVGDKLAEVMNINDIDIRLFVPETQQVLYPYLRDRGKRMEIPPQPLRGFSKHILETRQAVIINEKMAERMAELGSHLVPGTQMEKSYIAVPIMVGDRALGMVSTSNYEKENAFGDSDVRLLQTVVSAMSVALENARLFDETQRLLKETEQRAAELAIINSVQEGLASKLDMQAIYDLVGDKIRDIFEAQTVILVTYEPSTKLMSFPYVFEKGKRLNQDPLPMDGTGIMDHVILKRQPIMINSDMARRAAEITGAPGIIIGEGGQMVKSRLDVPMIVGSEARGVISLQNIDRENAFADSDLRLLQTLANSMSVALENARLFNAEQQRVAELAVINSIQQGLAAELDFQTIIDLVGDKLREVLNTGEIGIRWYDAEANIVHYLYEYEHNERIIIPSAPPRGKIWERQVATRKPIIMNSVADMLEMGVTAVPGTDQSKSSVSVPIVGSDRVLGSIITENYEKENAYTEADVRLLTTVASSMGVALENARLFNETQQRNAELAIINSVQQGLASKLEFQSIIDLIGDKITEIFNAQVTLISLYNAEKAEIDHKYLIERGDRILFNKPFAIDRFRQRVVDTRQPWLINQNYKQIAQEMGEEPVLEGEEPKALLFVPMIVGSAVTGVISLQNLDTENAFSESDLRLLSTIASSMSVSLENARLFQAEQKRVAELAAINSVGQTLTEELDLNVMVERVGDKLHKALNVKNIGIGIYDEKKNVMQVPYVCRDGIRQTVEPFALNAFNRRVSKAGRSLVVNKDAQRHWLKLGGISAGDEIPKSFVMVPLMAGRELVGGISLQDFEHEDAFADLSIGLLETVAANMGTAILNVRLFDETQRLLKETEQRVAELAIINSVQQGLASKLDMQAIYDLVGNKICEIFSLHTCYIMLYDREKGLEHYPFLVDNGKRTIQEDLPHDENGFGPLVMKTRQPIMINEDMEGRSREVGSYNITEDGTTVKSAIYVPLMIGSEARGVISVQNTQRENAFTDSDLRLLTTLASSMSVALESARLFVETEQRAAELATINSIQEGLASKLEPQAIYDLVGEKLREVFGAQFLYIAIHNRETNLIHFPYFWERDHREITEEPIRFGEGLTSRVIETRQPIVINTDWLRRATELGGVFLDGELPKSSMSVPIMSGNTAIGVISLQSTVAENQYSEAEVRLLSTIASSVGVALEGARLFEETEQRAAELAIINGVQEGLASKLEVQAIYELIGEKLRDLFGNMAISLVTFDLKKDIHHYEYIVEKGQRLQVEDAPITLTGRHLIRTRQTLLVNDHIVENLAKIGITMQIIPGTETPQSILRVPILIGNRVHGFIGLSDLDRENAFSPSDVRLLQTLAGSLSVALENARLFEETNRNAAELATVNTVSSALASELDIDPLIQLVGEQARTIFGADIVYVALLDDAGKTINFPYTYGEDLTPMSYGEGLTSKIIQTGKPLLLNQDVDKKVEELGATSVGVSSESYLGVPIFVGGRAVGVLSVQSLGRQGVFDENSQRLLTTIGSTVGSALHNARLYREAQESRAAAEQANKAKSAFLANMSHELRTPLNAIIGFTRIVRRKAEGALPDKQTDNLDKVLSSAEHLLSLINTVLDIAKIEAGRMEVQASNFNIAALADLCANTATPLLKPKVRLEKVIDPALTIVHSDQDKIKQIVLNLLSNAAKFTHEGKIVLHVHRLETDLVVDVTDSGIGISEEALGRIFEEFQQADTSTTRQYGGTGLGLAISRNLARLLGGDLTATSEVGKGSTFTLAIPMQYGSRSPFASRPEPESTPQAAHLLKADASKKLILVIDDDPDAVYLLQENLSAQEFEIVGTRNGLEGQQMARDLQPQAILLDIIMPDKDGWQVLHDLKADEATKDIPVILLTIVDKKALGFQLGASAYLLKPLDPAAVQDALKRVTAHNGNGHVHVLVVDDDPHVADMLKQSLPESTFKLDSAEDGMAGLQAIEAHRPDVVLLDIMMPRLDGFGVIEKLRASEATRDLPIIVISAKELTDEEMKTLEERVNFVMKKQGFDGEKLMQEINGVLKK